MKSPFSKISRVRGLLGSTRWYLTDDCLLAAKQVMYTVEYRRFYLHDLESIVVWPSKAWMARLIVPAVLLDGLGAMLGLWVNFTTGAVFGAIGLAWVALELILGPTAKSRIRTSGASIDLPLVPRTRRARKVLAKIDDAIRAARGAAAQPAASTMHPEPATPAAAIASGDSAPAIADNTQTNGT